MGVKIKFRINMRISKVKKTKNNKKISLTAKSSKYRKVKAAVTLKKV